MLTPLNVLFTMLLFVTVVAPAEITASTTRQRKSISVRAASSGENSMSGQRPRARVTPATGSQVGGTTVTLSGGNFLGAVTVTIGGRPAMGVTVVDAATVTAVAPIGDAGAADVVVTTAQGSATLPLAYTFTAASLYVLNGALSQWSVHALTDAGDVPPTRVVGGLATQLTLTDSFFVANGKVYVGDAGNNYLRVFDAAANGNVAPIQSIHGAATQIQTPYGIFVDLQRDEILLGDAANRVTVHDVSSNGNVAPLRVLQGASTGLNLPAGVWVHDGELFVANTGANTITVYGVTDAGDTAPRRTIGGASTGLAAPQGLCVAGDELFVANLTGQSITAYPTTASGDVAPTRTITGAQTGLTDPYAVFVTPIEIFVANGGSAGVTVHPITTMGNVAPARTLAGAATGFGSLRGIAVR